MRAKFAPVASPRPKPIQSAMFLDAPPPGHVLDTPPPMPTRE
jgi:hypothetical protein